MKKKREKVLLIGAGGRIGQDFIEEYKKKYSEHYELILGMHHPEKTRGFKVLKAELSNKKNLKKSMKNISVVVNLAANPDQNAKFEEILEPNIVGAYNVFEAAKESGVKRVVFASSIHAIKGYSENHPVKPGEAPKPLNFYGASKVFAESLCNVYSANFKISCLAIRIGAYVSDDEKRIMCLSREEYDHSISQRDMGQLIHKSIIAPKKVKFGILSGISDNKKKHMSLESTKKLVNYKPQDDEFKVCKKLKKKFNKK